MADRRWTQANPQAMKRAGGNLGQRANPQLSDPMQNRGRQGLPVPRAPAQPFSGGMRGGGGVQPPAGQDPGLIQRAQAWRQQQNALRTPPPQGQFGARGPIGLPQTMPFGREIGPPQSPPQTQWGTRGPVDPGLYGSPIGPPPGSAGGQSAPGGRGTIGQFGQMEPGPPKFQPLSSYQYNDFPQNPAQAEVMRQRLSPPRRATPDQLMQMDYFGQRGGPGNPLPNGARPQIGGQPQLGK